MYICIHVVVPHQLTCRRCTEFNYVSAAPDYMVRKKIRQKVARQLITSIVMLWTNLQHLQFFVAEKFFDKIKLTCLGVARWLSGRASDLLSSSRGFEARPRRCCVTTLGKLFTPYCLCHQAV